MYFRNCYEYKNYKFQDWIEKVDSTSLKEMKVASQTIKRHLGGILNYFEKRTSEVFGDIYRGLYKQYKGFFIGQQ
ncbi:MAG: transposase [Bacteroidetes bacterium]|nr:transposase [Bacteroidota bacterium]